MYCTNCGEKMNENQAICLKCGVKNGTEKNYCYNCGTKINSNQSICIRCGVDISKGGRKYDKTTMIIVCIFGGVLGIHCFIMGEYKKGLLRLFTLGGYFVLAIMDLVKLINDTYEVNPNKWI